MKKLITLSLLLLIAPAASSQNFSDDFEDAPASDFAASSTDWDAVWDGDGWNTETNTNGVSPNTDVSEPGQFGTTADAFENAIVTGQDDWHDYTVEAQFYADDNDTFGIVFRYTSPDSFYLLLMSRNAIPSPLGSVEQLLQPQTRLYRINGGQATQLIDPLPTAYINSSEEIQNVLVEADNTTIRVWLNAGQAGIDPSSEPLIETTDDDPSALTTGRAGLYAFDMGEESPGTYFDTFRVRPIDSDGDGKTNDDERENKTDPYDMDSDDDGIPDGDEFDWTGDADSDGIINALDWDSDNDSLPDGLERGYKEPNPDTDESAGHFKADEGPNSNTNHLDPDSDKGGFKDNEEDLNGNGRYEPELGETDPNNPEDDGQYPDTDTAEDTGADTGPDTAEEPDTEKEVIVDAGPDAQPQKKVDWGSLHGGPSCSCNQVGNTKASWLFSLLKLYL